jgi:trimeric autotransporter adhesin
MSQAIWFFKVVQLKQGVSIMQRTHHTESVGSLRAASRRFVAAALLATTALFGFTAATAAPLAGSAIGNQASATYTDASATPRTSSSNTVVTTVAQVDAFVLSATQSKVAAPGSPVSFPHTLINNGNGSSTFSLATGTLTGTAMPLGQLFIDSTCSGVASNGTPLTSIGPVAPGATVCFVATATANAVAAGAVGSFVVTATDTTTNSVPVTLASSQTNTDSVTISGAAVIGVTKAVNLSIGPVGSVLTYTLTYTNTGAATATNVILADTIPAHLTYTAGVAAGNANATWNGVAVTQGTATTAVVTSAAPGTIAYNFNAGVVTAIVGSVAPGVTGTVSFQVVVAGTAVPAAIINNSAAVCYTDGGVPAPAQVPALCSTATPGTIVTNVAGFTVQQTASVTISGPAAIATATQGATVSFTNIVTNTGNATDSFNITIGGVLGGTSAFPAGTTFKLYKSDGVSPLVDTGADGIEDTGPLAAGASYNVILQATLPVSASGAPAGGYSIQKTATSVFNPAVSAPTPATDRLTAIIANTVDLTNNPGGAGLGPELTAVTTISVVPGAAATFKLAVANNSTVSDTFDLTVGTAASAAGGGLAGAITTAGLPAGWTIGFFADASAGACTALGAPATNTGVLAAGATGNFCAVITPPANQAPGTTNVYFQAQSPSSGTRDVKLDAVTVQTVNALTLTPNNNGQVYPTGSVVYAHSLQNAGNVAQTVTLTVPMSGASASWSTVVYLDNGATPGVLDAGDTLVTGTVVVSAGVSVPLLVKVFAPGTATSGNINTVTLTGTAGALVATATDTTTVITGQVTLVKTQSVDITCTGTAGTYSAAPASAKPGECVLYQIVATNVGTAPVTGLVISDATPANTLYDCSNAAGPTAMGGAAVAAATSGTVTNPAICTAGTISVNVGTLAPNATSTVTFGVQIAP